MSSSSNLRYQTLRSANRAAVKLDALLTLSRALAGSRQEGITSDALELLLEATGYSRGAAFVLEGGALELVTHRGLPAPLRRWVERLPLSGPSWFLAQTAMHARSVVGASKVSTAQSAEIGAPVFAAAGWAQAVACPITAGRDIHGVMMLAGPAAGEPDETVKATVEIACRLLAHQIPQRGPESRGDGAGSAQVAALAVLTCGLAAELDDQLGVIERGLQRQLQLAEVLKRHGPAGAGLEVEAAAKSAAAALRRADEIANRLLATFQSAFPAESEPAARESSVSSRGAPSAAPAGVRPPHLGAPAARTVEAAPSTPAVPVIPQMRASDPGPPPPPRSVRLPPTAPATPAAIAAKDTTNARFTTWRSQGTPPLNPRPTEPVIPVVFAGSPGRTPGSNGRTD